MDNEYQNVVFRLGKEHYGLNIMIVQEIIRMPETIVMPDSQYYITGVANLRGDIIPIVDLKRRFSLPDMTEGSEEDKRVIVALLNSAKIGLMVDRVDEVCKFKESDIRPCDTATTDVQKEFIKGIVDIGNRMIILLDLSHAL
ncbi:MAG: chemotaxis protein CheW [Peptococcaceae bacterium]|jgi:purine-binding chemotaxis protein CheW|nr:chemotaxis protein CheW [Peptococcaceae bacterium]